MRWMCLNEFKYPIFDSISEDYITHITLVYYINFYIFTYLFTIRLAQNLDFPYTSENFKKLILLSFSKHHNLLISIK